MSDNYINPDQLLDVVNGLVVDDDFTKTDAEYLINYLLSKGDLSGSPRDLIQIRRGMQDSLPNLAQGEMAFTLDTKKLFVGGLEGNVEVTADITYKNPIEVTVGATGDFNTLNEALKEISNKRVEYKENGVPVIIRLLNDFTMREQIIVDGVDLGFITIVADGGLVTVERNNIRQELTDGRRPVFGGNHNAVLPIINCAFILSPGSEQNIDGVLVANGSYCTLGENASFKGFFRNLSAFYSSEINQYRNGLYAGTSSTTLNDYSNALDTAIFATNNSKIGCAFAKLDNATFNGVMAIWGSTVDAYRTTAKNCGSNGYYARDNSSVNARETDASGSDIGYQVMHNSQMDARFLPATSGDGASNCRIGVYANASGSIDCSQIKALNCSEIGIFADHASRIHAYNCNVSHSKIGIFAKGASQIQARQMVTSSNEYGIQATEGGIVSAQSSTINNCTVNGVYANSASIINVESSNINDCEIAIIARGASLINGDSVNTNGSIQRSVNIARASTANFRNANLRKDAETDTPGSNGDIVVFDGGIVNAVGASGGKNVTVNTLTRDGIVFG